MMPRRSGEEGTVDLRQVVLANADRKKKKTAMVATSTTSTESLTLTTRVNHPSYPAGREGEVAVLASLVAEDHQGEEEVRNPLDLVIVLDRSGSMAGEKLELCKKTLEFLVEKALTEDDYLAIITFDTGVYIEYPGGMMTKENKDIVLQRISNINSGSSTNLSGGLFAGLDLLAKASTAEVSAICLLSDGQMNHGISDREVLIKTLEINLSKFPEAKAKPSIFTFGYGVDADTLTMKAIAEASGGNFYTIPNVEAVPISFADCLGGLTAVAAQNVELNVEIAGGELSGNPLTKFPFTKISPSTCQIQIKDMYCGERRDLVFKVKLPISSTATGVKVTCKYMDTIHEKFVTAASVTEVTRHAGTSIVDLVPDAEVTRHLIRLEAVQAMQEARGAGERGDLEAGQRQIERMLTTTTETMLHLGITEESDLMMAEVVADLKEAQTNLRTSVQFRTVGQSAMASAEMSHGYQRSNKASSMMSVGAEDRSAYAGASKKAMMKSVKESFGYE